MKERPILMSAPMVRAILDGRKTQTRRVVKGFTPPDCNGKTECLFDPMDAQWKWYLDGKIATHDWEWNKCPHGQPGDRLIIKEAAWMWCEKRPNGVTKKGNPKWHYVPLKSARIHYVADHREKPKIDVVSPETGNSWGWRFKVARFMPRWASRITLEITGVRVERLQEISMDDASDEGLEYLEDGPGAGFWIVKGTSVCSDGTVEAYEQLWESINGKESWAANPWVWVLEFRRVQP